jgi:hypothetical protein
MLGQKPTINYILPNHPNARTQMFNMEKYFDEGMHPRFALR